MKFSLKSSLVKNTGWMFLGQGLGYGLRMAYFIVIARLLGVLQYGIVVGAFAMVNLVAEYSRSGTGIVLLRYVSPDHKRFAAYWGNTLLVTLTMSGILIAILTFLAPHVVSPATAAIVFLTAIGSCFCEQITISATQAFMAFQEMRLAAMFNQMTAMLRTFAAVGMLIVLHHATARQWVIASASVSAVAMVIAVGVVTAKLGWPSFRPHLALKHAGEGAEYAFASSTTSAYNDLDKTMLSHYGMSAENGIYGMAYRIIEMGSAPLASIQLASQPRLFQLAESGPQGPIELGKRLTKHALAISAVMAAAMFIAAPVIPLLTGKGFSEGVSALRWLCLIPIFRSIHGTTGNVLTSVGFQRYRTITQLSVVALNFLLNLWLIPRHGWHGAAWSSLATDATLGVLNYTVLQSVIGKFRSNRVDTATTKGREIEQSVPATPLVSVIIPYYNNPKYVGEAVRSVQQQSYPNYELILIDDGSTIPATTVLKEYSGIHIARTENRGVSAARNLAFAKSSGEYLLFLDSDDRLVNGAIEAHLAAFATEPDAGLSFGPTRTIDGEGKVIREAHICRARKNYFLPLLESNLIGSPGATLMRRDAYVEAGMFNENFSMGEDYDLYLRIARTRPIVRHTHCALEYREHGANTSQAQERMLSGTMAVLDRLEAAMSDSERKRLSHARRRWRHAFRRRQTLSYQLAGLYFSFRAMWNVPLSSYFGDKS